MSTRNILITSASGNIGTQLVSSLLSNPTTASYNLVLPTRSASRLSSLLPFPTPATVHIAEGDISDATWIESLLRKHSVDTVFSNFVGIEELIYTLNLWDACANTGVKHVVFLSAAGDFGIDQIKNGGLLKGASAAHVIHKPILEYKLQYGDVPFSYTIIGPTLFFSNDLRSKQFLMKDGVFNEPLGTAGVSRVDPKDIGLAAARAIEDGGAKWAGKKICVGSKETYTGEQTAKLWGEALGKSVRAAGMDAESLRHLESELGTRINKAMGRDLVLMYKQFGANGFGMSEDDYKLQVEVLGKSPSSYEQFVKKTANAWRGEALGEVILS